MKKIIVLMFVTILPLMAFKLDVKDKINPKCLINIIKNGWSDNNKTLNNLIVKNAEKNLDSFNNKIKKFIVVKKGRDKYGMPWYPKLVLDRDDILLMLSYIKYLEKNGRKQEAKDIYKNILSGLTEIKKLPNITIKVIFDIVYQSLVANALNQSIKDNIYSKEDKKELCILAKEVLILNKDEFIDSVKLESEFLYKVWEKTSYDDAKKYVELGIDYDNLAQSTFMKDVGRKIKKYRGIYDIKLFAAIDSENPKDFDKLDKYIKRERMEINNVSSKVLFFTSSVWIKAQRLLGIKVKDFGYTSTVFAKILVMISIPNIKATFFDYKKQLEANKKLLKELGCK